MKNMTTYKLSDINTYVNDTELFIGYGDGYLSKIAGTDTDYIKTILSHFDNDSLEAIEVKELHKQVNLVNPIDYEYFITLLDWLKQNGIVSQGEGTKSVEEIPFKVGFIGIKKDESSVFLQSINQILERAKYKLAHTDGNPDFYIIMSPILNLKTEKEVYKDIYKNNIPHVYIDFSPYTVVLGPAINPNLKMHCLSCFFKRRIANTTDPETYLNLIKLDNIQTRQVSLLNSKLYNTTVEWLSNELIRLLGSDWMDGGLLGKSKSINFATDEFNNSKIIKTVGCDICNPREIYRPLNG